MTAQDRDRAALESILFADPDNVDNHLVYADWLTEQGDPRGELIHLQVQLEELAAGETRNELRQREAELLKAHEATWLGELAPLLLGTEQEQRAMFKRQLAARFQDRLSYTTQRMQFNYKWRFGWLDFFECENITVDMARTLATEPIARLLRTLICRGDEQAGIYQYEPGEDTPDTHFRPIEVFAHHPNAQNVRTLQFGDEVDVDLDTYDSGTQYDHLAPVVAAMPRIETLRIFGHIYFQEEGEADLRKIFSMPSLGSLRELQLYHMHRIPLAALAENPSVTKLETLLCFPHSFGGELGQTTAVQPSDVEALVRSPRLTSLKHLQVRCCNGGDAMAKEIVYSGILDRLETLDLRHGEITDEGAALFARPKASWTLRRLDVANNPISPTVVQSLRDALPTVNADDPPRNRRYGSDDIYYYGDSE